MKNNLPMKQMPNTKGVLGRVIKSVFHYYPRMYTIALVCIVFNAVISALPSLFMQTVYNAIAAAVDGHLAWSEAWQSVTVPMCILIGLYVISLISGAVDKQLLAVITQGYLKKMRTQMFNGMQDLPIRYFDTH
ncbi:MAG: ABC transporter ATP-binding protein, partial [Clostridia bacterium]|nr:ABC transporter ATP-binding protein [Clostridia bacterium]